MRMGAPLLPGSVPAFYVGVARSTGNSMGIRGSVDSRNFLTFGAILLAGISISVGIIVGQTYGCSSPAFQEHVLMDEGTVTVTYTPLSNDTGTYLVTYNATRAGETVEATEDKEFGNVSSTDPIELRFSLDDRPLRLNVTITDERGATLQRSRVTLDRD